MASSVSSAVVGSVTSMIKMGQIQRQVLMVLEGASRLSLPPALSYGDIALVIQDVYGVYITPGSVAGAVSGMIRNRDRYWVKTQKWSPDPFSRTWRITDSGRNALGPVVMTRKPKRKTGKSGRKPMDPDKLARAADYRLTHPNISVAKIAKKFGMSHSKLTKYLAAQRAPKLVELSAA